jgi:hypothetical protein
MSGHHRPSGHDEIARKISWATQKKKIRQKDYYTVIRSFSTSAKLQQKYMVDASWSASAQADEL